MADTTTSSTSSTSPPVPGDGRSKYGRIAKNLAGTVAVDRVGPLTMHWSEVTDPGRWHAWIAAGRRRMGEWDAGGRASDEASRVWWGQRPADADAWAYGLLSQLLVVPLNCHTEYGTDADGHLVRRAELGIDRAHFFARDDMHGPLHHLGHEPWPTTDGVKVPVVMHFWPRFLGGDDAWHWYAKTFFPAPGAPPTGPTTTPPTTPTTPNPKPGPAPTGGGTTPTGPTHPTGPTQPSGPTSPGGPDTDPPWNDPFGRGAPTPPWDPNHPDNPNRPGAGPINPWGEDPYGGGGWGPAVPGPILPNPLPEDYTAEAQMQQDPRDAVPGPPDQRPSDDIGPEDAFHFGRHAMPSIYELGTPAQTTVVTRRAPPSIYELGTPALSDEGALETAPSGTAIDWTAPETWTQTEVDGQRQEHDRLGAMRRDNAQGARIADVDHRLRSQFTERFTATITPAASTVDVSTTYAWVGDEEPTIAYYLDTLGYTHAVTGESGASGSVRTFTIELDAAAIGPVVVRGTMTYTVQRATAVAGDPAS